MNLFSKIYTFLLMGIFSLLIIDGNLNYESQIKQFDLDMAEKAKGIGRIMAEMINHAWRESGSRQAIQLIENAGRSDGQLEIRWVWLDEIRQEHVRRNPEVKVFDGPEVLPEAVSFVGLDEQRIKRRFTYVPVPIPGERGGALQLSQSLAPLKEYTQRTLIRFLIISALLALISGIILYCLINIKIRKPLEKLSRKAIEIGKGNLEANLEIKGDDELVGLSRIMNDMCTRLLIAQEKIHFENLARLKTLEQLRHTEKLSTVGQIAAGIAHEIGTPLNVVDGRAKMIISEQLQPEEIIGCAKIIKAQAERITLIIRQLLDFSRKKRAIHRTSENVVSLLHQVFHLLTPIATKQGVSLQLKVPPEAKVNCLIDAQQIQQVLMNVIMNGIQATPAKSSVQVDLTNVHLRSMIHTDDQLKEFVRIDINDEGEGIPAANLEKIFTPFFTTKNIGLGTGLGLSIAQELLEEHGGWIEVDNRQPKGAKFSIFLGLEEAA
jgi:signal transduction histidine kinase